jgi:hypothetical protein
MRPVCLPGHPAVAYLRLVGRHKPKGGPFESASSPLSSSRDRPLDGCERARSVAHRYSGHASTSQPGEFARSGHFVSGRSRTTCVASCFSRGDRRRKAMVVPLSSWTDRCRRGFRIVGLRGCFLYRKGQPSQPVGEQERRTHCGWFKVVRGWFPRAQYRNRGN